MIKKKIEIYKLYSNCRRGILELDIILINFLKNRYNLLNNSELLEFSLLLKQDDQNLYNWLVKKIPTNNFKIIDKINNFIKT